MFRTDPTEQQKADDVSELQTWLKSLPPRLQAPVSQGMVLLTIATDKKMGNMGLDFQDLMTVREAAHAMLLKTMQIVDADPETAERETVRHGEEVRKFGLQPLPARLQIHTCRLVQFITTYMASASKRLAQEYNLSGQEAIDCSTAVVAICLKSIQQERLPVNPEIAR